MDNNKDNKLNKDNCDLILKSLALYGVNRMIDVSETMNKIAKIKVNLTE